jgi:tetratricopeptide (TPR) repeat protein
VAQSVGQGGLEALLSCWLMRKHIGGLLGREISDGDRARLMAHIERCRRCRYELESRQALLARLPVDEVEFPPQLDSSFPARVRSEIERRRRSSQPVPRRTAQVHKRPGSGLSPAWAVVLIIVGVVIGLSVPTVRVLERQRGLTSESPLRISKSEAVKKLPDVLSALGTNEQAKHTVLEFAALAGFDVDAWGVAEAAGAERQRLYTADALYRKAALLRKAGKPREAIAVLSSLEEKFTGTREAADALLARGDIFYEDLHDYFGAHSAYETYVIEHDELLRVLPRREEITERHLLLANCARQGYRPVRLLETARREEGVAAYKMYSALVEDHLNSKAAVCALEEMARFGWDEGDLPARKGAEKSDAARRKIQLLTHLVAGTKRPNASALALLRVGDVYRDVVKDADLAMAQYQQVLDRYPNTMIAPEAQSRMNRLLLRRSSP